MVNPIDYTMNVLDPIQGYLEGLKFGEGIQTGRLAREETRQVMGMREAQERRAQANFEEQRRARAAARAEAERQRAQAEQGQAALAALVEKGSGATTNDFLEAWVANPAIRSDLTALQTILTEPQNRALLTASQNVYSAASQGNVQVTRQLLQDQLTAAENAGDETLAPSLRLSLQNLETDPEGTLSQLRATSAMTVMGLKGPEYIGELNKALGVDGEELPADYRNLQLRAREAGLEPGTSEYENFMLTAGAVDTSAKFRPATPEEAAQYGATGGQVDITTGRFYPIQPPSGMTVRTTPEGGVEVVQGPGAQTRFREQETKDIVYATRAEGALADLEPVANELANLSPRLFEYVPLGQGRQFQSPEYQRANIAAMEFLAAILRKDTGAAITNQEIEIYGQTYLPQPGDSPAALEQKAKARRRAIEALRAPMSEQAQTAVTGALIAGGEGVDLDFSTMSGPELIYVDIYSLTRPQKEAFSQRLKELNNGR
jgi:hypothetical protein